ncbi:P-loop containing nucleoside triphosphate hydrolase protein [Nadsonia fulvescens var. elongata DSM 6958]|uniref:p-loop containing nucleoside triphosphate hydrolase protein n=1 Tax=Nadsonia fulvescens var. elongata DSM 6958 TaxID=857566 RepID=A0A1E3PFW3_9ASCO|nr:P-loop containing nucleoside triphosphate hydrolase protein [Nadsonia fulvescens var. elongata DSM 6958]
MRPSISPLRQSLSSVSFGDLKLHREFTQTMTSRGLKNKETSETNLRKESGLSPLLVKALAKRLDKPAPSNELIRLFVMTKKEWKLLTMATILLLISSAITISIPYFVGELIEVVTTTVERMALAEGGGELPATPQEDIKIIGLELETFYFVAIGALAVCSLANFGKMFLLRLSNERMTARLRSLVYSKLIAKDAAFYDVIRVGDMVARLANASNAVARSFTLSTADGIKSIFMGGVGLGMMAHISLELTGIAMLVVPPLGFMMTVYGNKIKIIAQQSLGSVAALSRITEERLSAARTIQKLAGERQEIHRYNDQLRVVFDAGKRDGFAVASFTSWTELAGNITMLTLILYGGQLIMESSLSIGELTSFLMYAGYVSASAMGLTNFYTEIMKGAGAVNRFMELYDWQTNIKPTVGTKAPFILNSTPPEIEFRNVKFAYPTRPNSLILPDFSLKIPAGSSVCLVGPSGGGKSTIASLLLRYYDPVEGQLLLDGVEIREFNLRSLRKTIGVVSQSPGLLSDTIAENIAYGMEEKVSREKINQALAMADCQFVHELPDGIDTEIGPRGIRLSGGQRQRLAIARAIVRQPSILVLDEPTTSLDMNSQAAVNLALDNLLCRGNATTIMIAHNISTMRRTDKIILLNNQGRIIETGSFNELVLNKDSLFRKMYLDGMHGYMIEDFVNNRKLLPVHAP